MRLLHTADWHLGDRLGRIDRTADIRRRVEQIADYCRDEQIDVLIVAGDIFSETARSEVLREAIEHLHDTFAPFLHGGGTILAVTGNHDNETFCQTLRHAMSLAAPQIGAPGELATRGRLYLAAEPALVRLAGGNGEVIQFVLMPFPTPAVFLTGSLAGRYASIGEKNERLRSAFLARLGELIESPAFDRSLPAVLVAHIGVSGADLSNRFRITEDTDIVIEAATWPQKFTYVALGHIHKPQAVGGQAHVRYCGSIERLDLGEADDSKSVAVVEVGRTGLSATPRLRPLDATPIYRVEVQNLSDELSHLVARYPDRENALVNIHFAYEAGRDDLLDAQRRLDAIFPRWYDRDWHNRGELGSLLSLGEAAAKSFEETVRSFLDQQVVNWTDEDRNALLALANQYLQGVAAPPAS